MTAWQTPRHDVDEMDERVAGEKESQSQVNRVSAINVACRPCKCQGYDHEYDAQVTNKVLIEWASVGNVGRQVCVPRIGEEKHPRAIYQAEDAGNYIE